MFLTRLKTSLAIAVALCMIAVGPVAWHYTLAGPQAADQDDKAVGVQKPVQPRKIEPLPKGIAQPGKEVAALPANLPQNNVERLPHGAVGRLGTLRWRHAALMLAFSPHGQFLAAAGDKTTQLFAGRTGKLIHEVAGSGFVAFSPDSKTLFTSPFHDSKSPRPVRVWDVDTGAKKRQFTPDGNCYSSWSQDGKTMIAAQWRFGNGPAAFVVTLWDMTTGKPIRSFVNPIDNLGDSQVTLTPDGKAFDAARPASAVPPGRRHRQGNPTLSQRARRRLPLGGRAGLRLFPRRSPVGLQRQGQRRRLERHRPGGGPDRTSAGGPRRQGGHGRFFARRQVRGGRHHAGAILLWDAVTGRLLHNLRDSETRLPIYLLAFSANGTLASQQQYIDRVRLWDVRTGKELSPLAPVTGLTIALTPDGSGLAALDSEGKLWHWTRKETKLIHRIPGWRPGCRRPREPGFPGQHLVAGPDSAVSGKGNLATL